jgi:hypothetical protein
MGGPGLQTSIGGTVRGAGDRPLRGACVTARARSGAAVGSLAASTVVATGADGHYLLTGLHPGAYTLSYRDCAAPSLYFEQWSGGADLQASARPVRVLPGQHLTLAAVRLRPTSQAAFIATSAIRVPRPAVARRNLASVSGVARNRSGKRLAGICVFIYPKGNYFGGIGGNTRRDGSYSFIGFFLPGKYIVQFTSGCNNTGNYAPQYWKYAATPARATVLHLRAGQHATGINARLGPGGTLSGTVRAAATGTPLGGVCVSISSGLYQYQVTTASDGTYLLHSLATGRYGLQFQPDCGNTGNYLPDDPHGTVRVTAGKQTTAPVAYLPPGAEIGGTVTGPGSAPVAGICVYDSGNFPSAKTAADGSYSIQRLYPGFNYLSFAGGCGSHGSYAPQYYPGQSNPAATVPVQVSAGQIKTGVNANLSPGGTVTGTVTNTASLALTGLCAAVFPPSALEPNNQNFFIPVTDLWPYISTARTHAGAYRIRNLAPGLYYAIFGPCASGTRYPIQWFNRQGAFGRASLVWVAAGTVTAGINAVLPLSGTISGTVTNAAGRQLTGICVFAYNVAGQDWMSLRQVTSRRGRYRVTDLAPGRYRVLFGPCLFHNAKTVTQWYPAAADISQARPVLVRSGRDTGGINAVLRNGGSISGRVVTAAGRPVGGCGFVTAVDSAGTFMAGGLVGKTGHFRIAHLLAGRYSLQACDFGAVNKPGVVVRGTRPTTGVTIVLPDTGSLAGRAVTSAGAVPEPGVCVTAFPRAKSGQVVVAATNLAGRWRISGLDPGLYRILFSPVCMAGFPPVAPQWFDNAPGPQSATLVRVTADGTNRGIDALMAPYGGVSGTVTDSAHVPLLGICVTAVPQAPGSISVTAATASDGSYTINDLTPGSYQVDFAAGCGATGYVTQRYSAAVTVAAGATTTGIDATMQH